MSAINTVPELLRAQASRIPDQPFVRWRGRSVSYAEFDTRTDALAAGLADLGRQARRRGIGHAAQLPRVSRGVVGGPQGRCPCSARSTRRSPPPEAAYVVGHFQAVAVVTDARGCGDAGGREPETPELARTAASDLGGGTEATVTLESLADRGGGVPPRARGG